MDLYTQTSERSSKIFMKSFSTSFSFSSLLFPKETRQHIANIYGLVRIADEIVDTYMKSDSLEILNNLEEETYKSLKRKYSVNPIVHSFALTAVRFDIGKNLIKPFFDSMRDDITLKKHTEESISIYIYGSAEVIGLMCLKIFCDGDEKQYKDLSPGARALGSAYQKINFLRDLSSDSKDLGRTYFPQMKDGITNEAKNRVVAEMRTELSIAGSALTKLPQSAQKAVKLSKEYYSTLLDKLEKTDISEIMENRVRVNNAHKMWLFARVIFS